jgi:hypothetical protein
VQPYPRQRYRPGQEEQLGALGLIVNAIVIAAGDWPVWRRLRVDQDGCEICGGLKGSAHHPDVEEVRRLVEMVVPLTLGCGPGEFGWAVSPEAAVSRGERRGGEPEGEL